MKMRKIEYTTKQKYGGNLLPLFRCVTRASCGRIVPSRSNHDARPVLVGALTRREVYDSRCLSGQCPAQSPREKDDLVPRSEVVLEVQMRNKHQAAIAREQADDNIVRPRVSHGDHHLRPGRLPDGYEPLARILQAQSRPAGCGV